jgi:hypothetical protein
VADIIVSADLLKDETFEVSLEGDVEVKKIDGTTNYEELSNLPSINGTTLKGNYNELDPTVPDWAKDNLKPKYSADEIGAIDVRNEISFADIKELWDSIFS